MDWFKSFAKVLTGLGPILGAVAGYVFPGSSIATGIIAALPSLVESAEKAIGDGNGAVKKEYVMTGAEELATTMAGISTGGQKETWEKIAPVASTIVDGICAAVKLVNSDWIDDGAKWGQ